MSYLCIVKVLSTTHNTPLRKYLPAPFTFTSFMAYDTLSIVDVHNVHLFTKNIQDSSNAQHAHLGGSTLTPRRDEVNSASVQAVVLHQVRDL
jgi:hypothetical protein